MGADDGGELSAATCSVIGRLGFNGLSEDSLLNVTAPELGVIVTAFADSVVLLKKVSYAG